MQTIPVVLFAYNRPRHLRQTLDCLKEGRVPLIYAFSDGPRTSAEAPKVREVRETLYATDWCELILCERPGNLGLGRSVRAGVTSVFEKHDAALVFEDDLICVPGTYAYLCAALEHYQNDTQIMSVTGWAHPSITPSNVSIDPYFDGRAECWVWGTWSRAWRGMDLDALTIIRQCRRLGIDVYRYGADLHNMAQRERSQNIWAVRWLYHHILHGGLCLRPPHSLVEHIGFDRLATNFAVDGGWANPPLEPCPPIPTHWPPTVENPQCATLWQQAMGHRPSPMRRAIDLFHRAMTTLAR
jgi:hypothetical protein